MTTQMKLECHSEFWGPVKSWFLGLESAITKETVLSVLGACVWGLQRAIEIMDQSGMVLTQSCANEASQALHMHLQTYAWLALYYHDQKCMLFRIRPKTHILFHMAEEVAAFRLNFAIFWTFAEESFLGKVKAIATKTHGATMTQRVFQRYLLYLAIFIHRYKRQ